jgi:SAM-dependent methyltransferase
LHCLASRFNRNKMTCFDSYACDYEGALNRGLAVSGESKDYFAAGRLAWLSHCLERLNIKVRRVLDFGCGTGTATPLFFDLLGAESVLGVDPSEMSLSVAREKYAGLSATFQHVGDFKPQADIDLAFCNGVFHHIPGVERQTSANYIAQALRPGGVFAIWENNPWSPAARLVMSRIPFDRDAVMVWPVEARRLCEQAGLSIARTDFAFIFPKKLSFMRVTEPWVRRLPLGAQYQVLSIKK